MKIAQSQVHLSGRYQREQLSAELTSRSTPEREAGPGQTSWQSVTLSNRSSEQQKLSSHSSVSSHHSPKTVELSSEQLIRQTANYVLQQELTINNPRSATIINGVEVKPAQIQIEQVLTTEEREQFVFETLGKVSTEDGREIEFMMTLELDRSTSSEQQMSYKGEFVLIDPLMINFEGDMIEFTDMTFDFDLDGDGDIEQLAQTASGSGYLVFDKNQNGEIDDGSEMFGPQSGQGFEELAAYDDDGNGWIDENDAILQQLQIMTFDDGEAVNLSLAEAGVGAFYLGKTESDYQLRNSGGTLLGNLKQSGVALSEDGQALAFQEIHLADQSQQEALIDASEDFQLLMPTLPQVELRPGSRLLVGEEIDVSASLSFSLDLMANTSGIPLNLARPVSGTSQMQSGVRDWVNQVMFGRAEASGSQRSQAASAEARSFDKPQQAGNQFIDSDKLQQQQVDSRLWRLRSMVEELKAMQSEAQQNTGRLASETVESYKKVGRY